MRNTLLKSLLLLALLLAALAGGLTVAAQDTSPVMPVATFEIDGLIESIDGDTLVVAGQTVDISAALLDDDVRMVVGEQVEVYATFADGVFVAFLVDDADDDLDGLIEITGTLEAIDAATLTVAGITFDTTGAIFEDDDDGPLVVGELVEVHATFNGGVWQAVRVDDEDDRDDRDDNNGERGRFDRDDYDYELTGVLEEIGEGFIVVSGQTIDTTSASFDDDVRVGERVEVEFIRVEGVLVAIYVDDIDLAAGRDDDDDDNGSNGSGRDDEDDLPAGFEPAITAEQAAAIALEVFPNERVIDVDLEIHDETGRVAWEVDLSNGVDIYVDATTGTRLEVDMPGRDDDDDDDDNGRDDNDDRGNSGNNSGGSGGDDDDDDDDDNGRDDNDDRGNSGNNSGDTDGDDDDDDDDDTGGDDNDDDDDDDDDDED